MLKRSKQRESIKKFLISRYDHLPQRPSIWISRKNFRISVSVRYTAICHYWQISVRSRNCPPELDLIVLTVIQSRITILSARNAGSVLDLNVTGLDHINVLAAQDFDGEIEGHVTYFYGKCSSCKAKRQTSWSFFPKKLLK